MRAPSRRSRRACCSRWPSRAVSRRANSPRCSTPSAAVADACPASARAAPPPTAVSQMQETSGVSARRRPQPRHPGASSPAFSTKRALLHFRQRGQDGGVADIAIDPELVVWSTEPEGRDQHPLVIVMHGRGSDERDLASLFTLLPSGFTSASLRAPHDYGPGFAWFDDAVEPP